MGEIVILSEHSVLDEARKALAVAHKEGHAAVILKRTARGWVKSD